MIQFRVKIVSARGGIDESISTIDETILAGSGHFASQNLSWFESPDQKNDHNTKSKGDK